MAINKRKLGRTEIEISPIGLGVMQFAGGRDVFRFMYSEVTAETLLLHSRFSMKPLRPPGQDKCL